MQNLLLTLQTLSQKLVSELNVENILTDIMKTLGEALGAVWVNIWELTPDGKKIYIKQGYGRKGTEKYITHSRAHPIPLGVAFIGRAIKTKKTWSSSDMWTDPHLPRTWIKTVKEQHFRGIVCVPQIVESAKVIGGMCVYFKDVRVLSDFEMRLITIAANQAAVSVVNANIYNELIAERDKTLATINSLNEGVILYDNENRVLLLNPKAQEILLVQPKDILGKTPTKEMFEKNVSLKNLYEISHLTLSDYEAKEYSFEEPSKTILEITAVPVRGTGHLKIGSMRILRDITREKEVDIIKSKFISTASHQLRTPLSGIRWALDALRGGDEGPLTTTQQNLVEKTYKTATGLNELLDNLLDASKIEERGLVYVFREYDLLSLVKNIIKEFSVQLQEQKITLVLREPTNPIPKVQIDPKALSMAIRNFIDNAIRYSLPGKKVLISLSTGMYYVMLFIKDSGIGIPKEEQKSIFSKFFRAKNAQLLRTEGSGLGLYLAKSIVEKHNGRVMFESKENQGSEFSIYLPLEEQKMPLNRKK